MAMRNFRQNLRYNPIVGLSVGVVAVGLVTTLMKAAAFEQYLYNVALVYIIVVLLVASRYGFLPGIVTSLLAFVCLDYFFIPPFGTFYIDSVAGVVGVIGFGVAATLTSRIASESRHRTVEAQARQREMAAINGFSTAILTEPADAQIYTRIVEQVGQMLNASPVLLYLPSLTDESPLILRSATPNSSRAISGHQLEMVQRAFIERTAIYDSSSEQGYRAYLPVLWGETALGVLAVQFLADAQQRPSRVFFDNAMQHWLHIVANQVALAVDHATLSDTSAGRTATNSNLFAILESTPDDIEAPLAALQTALARLRDTARTLSRQEQDIYLSVIDQKTNQIAQIVADARAIRPID